MRTIQRLQKLTKKKKRLPIIILVQCVLRKSSKNEWSLNQFNYNFESNYVQTSFFSNFIVFSVKNTKKTYEPKIISKEPIQIFTPKSYLVDRTKIKIVAKEKNKSPHPPVKFLENCFKTTNKCLNSKSFL